MIGGQHLRQVAQFPGYRVSEFGTQCFAGIVGDFVDKVLIVLIRRNRGRLQLRDVITQFRGFVAREQSIDRR